MYVDGVSYEAMLENPRNEFKLYTLTDGRVVPVLRYVPIGLDGRVIANPNARYYRPIEYEIRLAEGSRIEIVGPLKVYEDRIMVQRWVIGSEMVKILHELSQTSKVMVGTLP